MIPFLLNISSSLIYAILFLLPGIMLSLAAFPNSDNKRDPLRHAIFAICFSSIIFAIFNFFNNALGIHSALSGIAEYACLVAALCLALARKKTARASLLTKEVGLFAIIAAFGAIWKLIFVWPIQNMGSAYDYASQFSKDAVPDLGFYTGMAADHANYAIGTANAFWTQMQAALANPGFDISLFLITFAYLGFAYILCIEYSANRRSALFVTMIMALGPFEIFYTTSSVFGHSMAYLAIFGLFFLFKNSAEIRARTMLAAGLCVSMAITYYTSTLANIIVCAGFCASVLLEKATTDRRTAFVKAFLDKRMGAFIAIAAISAGMFIAMSSNMLDFTHDMIQDTTAIRSAANIASHSTTTVFVGTETLRPYRDPAFFGISAIRAQAIIFIAFGSAFAMYWAFRMRRRKIARDHASEAALNQAALAMIPVILTSFAFIYAGYPARAFDYFGFYAALLLALAITATSHLTSGTTLHEQIAVSKSSRLTDCIWIAILIIMIALGLQTMRDKRIYFERSDGEVAAAKWIAGNLDGKVLSDQVFVSQIILNGYYDVTGTSDTDPRLTALFYQHDEALLLAAATSSLGVDYIVTTKRMRESYILMLDTPQIAIQNSDLIDAALKKVYDNGDVRIYATGKKATLQPKHP